MTKNRSETMKIFGRSRDKPKEKRELDPKLNDFIRGVDIDYGGGVASGVAVDELRAMQTSAVYACVRVLSETVRLVFV
jgi:phage portal protein BeeE